MVLQDNPTGPPRNDFGLASSMLLAATALWCLYWFVHSWNYWEDDAWIHLEFARSLAAGRGFAFNGHVVAGDTAPVWVLLLAGMHALIPDWIVAGKVLTILGAGLGIVGTFAFARRMTESIPALQTVVSLPSIMVVLVAVNPYTC